MWRARSTTRRAITAVVGHVWSAPSASAATVARLSAASSSSAAAAPSALSLRSFSIGAASSSSSTAPFSRASSDPADVAASIARAELDRVAVAEAAADRSDASSSSAARLKRAAQRKRKIQARKDRDAAMEEREKQNLAVQTQAFNAAASAALSLSTLLGANADPTSKGSMPFTSAAAAAAAATGLPIVPFTASDESQALGWLATFDAMSLEERRGSEDDAFVPSLFFSLLRINRATDAWRVHREYDAALGPTEAAWTVDRVRVWLEAFLDHAAPLHTQEAERIWMRMAADPSMMQQADASLYRRMIQIYLRDGRQSSLDKIESFWATVQSLPITREMDVRARRFRAEDFEAIITLARERNLPEQVSLWSQRARVVGVWSSLPESVRYAELLQLRQQILYELRDLIIRSVGRFPNSAWDHALFSDREWMKIRQSAREWWTKLVTLMMQEPLWSQTLTPEMTQGLLESLRVHQLFQKSQALYAVMRKQAMHAIEKQKIATRAAKDAQRVAHRSDPLDILDEPALAALKKEEVFVPTPLPEAERVPYPILADLFSLILRAHEEGRLREEDTAAGETIAGAAAAAAGSEAHSPEFLSAELGRSTLEDMLTPALAGRFALRGGLLTMLLEAYRASPQPPARLEPFTAIYEAMPHKDAETHAAYCALAERLGQKNVADAVRARLESNPADAESLSMSLEFLTGEMQHAVLKPTSDWPGQVSARAEALWARAKAQPDSLMTPQVVQAMVEFTEAARDIPRMSAVIMEALQIEAESAAAAAAAASTAAAATPTAGSEDQATPAPAPAAAAPAAEPRMLVGFDSFATLMRSWLRSADPSLHSGDAAQVFGMMQARFFAASPAQRNASLPSLRQALATFAQLERVTSRVTVLARWRGLLRADKERNPLLLLAVLSEIAESPRPDTAEASRTVDPELSWFARSPFAVDLFHMWLQCYAGGQNGASQPPQSPQQPQQQAGGDWVGAESVCERMVGLALQPTEVTYTTLMGVYMASGSSDQLRQIEKLYAEMRAGSGPGGKLILGPRELATMVRTARMSASSRSGRGGAQDEELKWINRARNAGLWPATQKEMAIMDKQAKKAEELAEAAAAAQATASAAAAAAATASSSAAPVPPVVS